MYSTVLLSSCHLETTRLLPEKQQCLTEMMLSEQKLALNAVPRITVPWASHTPQRHSAGCPLQSWHHFNLSAPGCFPHYPCSLMPPSYLSERESGEENLSWLISLIWDRDYKEFVTLCIYSMFWKCSKDFVTRRVPYSWVKFAFLWFLLKVNTVFP